MSTGFLNTWVRTVLVNGLKVHVTGRYHVNGTGVRHLPIWKNPTTGDYKVFGSLAELQQYLPKSGNTYYVARHAEAESNLGNAVIDAVPDENNPLTEHGRSQCAVAAEKLRAAGITHIVHSGMQRARETAEIIARELGLDPSAVVADVRIQEFRPGDEFEGKTWAEFNGQFGNISIS